MSDPTGAALPLHSRRDHPNPKLNHCPRCSADLMLAAIADLAYVFDPCNCGVVPYTHLVEQLWHRTCHAAEVAGQLLDQHEQLIGDARRETLAAAIKAILAEAGRGPGAAPPRQRLTYPGGLRRAARLLDGLLGQERAGGGRRVP